MASVVAFFIVALASTADLEESLRQHYESGRWEKFFAYALVYRLNTPASERSDVQLLEPLALLRHCQGESLQKVAAEILASAPQHKSTIDQILALSRTRFKGKAAEDRSSQTSPLLAHFQGRSFSKAKTKNIQKLDPEKLIVKVKNLCES